MGYCLMCGMLRKTRGGICEQCRIDRSTADLPARKVKRLRRRIEEERRADAGKGGLHQDSAEA